MENFNRREIETVDLFDGTYLRDACRKALKKSGSDMALFAEELRGALMYQYWGRCEYETVLTSWPPDKSGEFRDMKIDVYDQVALNWDAFIEYVWNRRDELS